MAEPTMKVTVTLLSDLVKAVDQEPEEHPAYEFSNGRCFEEPRG